MTHHTKVKWNFRYFTPEEMACRHCGECEMDMFFMAMLDAMRDDLGFPLPVNSAYRCPIHDKAVGGKGAHTTGQAVDIAVYGERASQLLTQAVVTGIGGIGIKQHGPHAGRYFHLDTIDADTHPRPAVWTYT